MKRINVILSVLFCAIVVSATSAFADNIGFLDMERLFANYKDGKEMQAEVQKRREAYQAIVEEKQKSVQKAREEKKSDEEIQKMITAVEGELRPKQEEILQYEAEIQGRLIFKIKEISKSVAKVYGVDVVLDRRAVFAGGFDLTDFVVEKLNNSGSEDVGEKSGSKSTKKRKR